MHTKEKEMNTQFVPIELETRKAIIQFFDFRGLDDLNTQLREIMVAAVSSENYDQSPFDRETVMMLLFDIEDLATQLNKLYTNLKN